MKHFKFKLLCAALSMLFAPSVLMALEKEGEDYLISTTDELIEFARLVNNGEAFNIYGNADAKLMADIDLRGRESEFSLIGSLEHPYQGIFDGQLHTITYDLVSTGEYCGLFAHLNGTSIYDLSGRPVENVTNGINIVNGRKVLNPIK